MNWASYERFILVGLAVAFIAISASIFVDADRFMLGFGIELVHPDGLNEANAQWTGLLFAMAIFLLFAAFRSASLRYAALWVVLAVVGSVWVARLLTTIELGINPFTDYVGVVPQYMLIYNPTIVILTLIAILRRLVKAQTIAVSSIQQHSNWFLFEQVTTMIFALIYFTIGVLVVIIPDSFLSHFGIGMIYPDGLNEVRAQYSGFLIGLAIVTTVLSFVSPQYRLYSIGLSALLVAGILSGRILAVFQSGINPLTDYSPYVQAFMFIIDPGGAIFGGIVFMRGIWFRKQINIPQH